MELLCGPAKLACIYNRLVVENLNTGRMITYIADEAKEARYSCSYVQVLGEFASSPQPMFAQIKMCFTHTFAGNTRKLVLLSMYPTPQLDSESGIWWVPHETTEKVVVQVSSLSSPLVVAKEEGNVWFLNAKSHIVKSVFCLFICLFAFVLRA